MNYFGTPQKRDELEARLPGAAGLERLQVLVCVAWYSRQADTRRTIALVDEAEALLAHVSELAPAERTRCEARLALTRASAEWLHCRFDAASALMLQARDRFDALGDAGGASDACRVEGDICGFMGYHEAAGDARRAAEAYSEKDGDRLRAALCRGAMAWVAVTGRAADAEAQVNRFFDDVRALRHPLLDAEEAAIHGAAHNVRNDYAGSIIHYQRCCELRLANGQLWYAINAALIVSRGYRNIGDNVQALEWAERGVDLARSVGWPISISLGLREVASGMRSLRRFAAARELLHEALAVLRPFGRSDILWTTYQSLSEVACDLGEFAEALRWAREAEPLGPSNALALRPGPFLQGQLAQARALSGLNRPTEAFAQAQRTLTAATSISDDLWRIRTLIELAHMARAHGLALPEGSKAANAEIHYLEAALAVGQVIEGYGVPAELWSDLSRSHEAAGALAQAIACERRASAARESDASKKASDMATLLQVRFETERSKAQAAAARIETEYQRSLAVAEAAANRAKSVFLANMSHELRTPLNAVLGYAQILRLDQGLSEEQSTALNTIQKSGEHLLTLINDILDLSRIEAGRLDLNPGAIDLAGFLEAIPDIFRVRARQKGIGFVYDASQNLPRAVRGDENRLRQVLLNLLGNAVKFTDRGQVTLRVHKQPGDEGQARLHFEIEDTGPGIAAEHLESIFLPFEQVGDVQRRSGGTGLGLAISRELLRMMGGDIHVESTPGTGSLFWFDVSLPVIDAAAAASPARRIVSGYQGPRKKVLVIDDVAENRSVVADMLRPLGFAMFEAVDGREGLKQAQATLPHLILMDNVMPVMDGLEATRRLRQLPGLDGVPIISLSASASRSDKEHSLAAGASAFLPKPIDFDKLLDQVGALLHLSWNYREREEGTVPEAEPAGPLLPPPPEEMEVLLRLAITGNMSDIRQRAAYVASLDERYRPFAQQLSTLAGGYQSQAILQMVEKYRQGQ